MIERKWDGFRALYLPDHMGRKRLFSRNGMPLEGVEHILWELAKMEAASGQPMLFDGEIVVGDSLAETKAWFERGWKLGGTAGTFHAFDCLPLVEWQRGGTDRPLIERKAELRECARLAAESSWDWRPGSHGADEDADPVCVVEDSWAFEPNDVLDEARRIWSAGGEGCMIKDAEAGYSRARTNAWLKVKQGGRWMDGVGARLTKEAA